MDTIAHYGTAEDLTARIEALFQSLDVDESGKLSFREMWRGLQKLNFRPRIELTLDDFEALTDGGELCNDKGELGSTQVRGADRVFVLRGSIRGSDVWWLRGSVRRDDPEAAAAVQPAQPRLRARRECEWTFRRWGTGVVGCSVGRRCKG